MLVYKIINKFSIPLPKLSVKTTIYDFGAILLIQCLTNFGTTLIIFLWQILNNQCDKSDQNRIIVIYCLTCLFLRACSCLNALPIWYKLVQATNTLTANKLQFLGMITREYRDQMSPVAARDADWGMDKVSTGRFKSPNPAITKPWKC